MPTFEHRDWNNPVIDRSTQQNKAVVCVINYNLGTTHHYYFIPMKFGGAKSAPYVVELQDQFPKYGDSNLNIIYSFYTTTQGWDAIRKNAGTRRATSFMEFGPARTEFKKLKDSIKLWQRIPGPTHVIVEWIGPSTSG